MLLEQAQDFSIFSIKQGAKVNTLVKVIQAQTFLTK